MPDVSVILIAEDDEDHVLLIQKAFEKAGILNPLMVVTDGEQVISYLKGEGKYSDRKKYCLPKLLLLDIKLRRINGFEVLKWLRQQPSLARLRVLVLASSDELRDVNQAYQLGANSFLLKPHDFEDSVQLSRLIKDFWLKASVTPEISGPPGK